MRNNRQIMVSVALLLVALAGVAGYTVWQRTPTAVAGMTGHVHGAAPAADAQGPKLFSISEERARRIGVAYAVAHMSMLGQSVRSVGTIAYDETRQADVNPKIEGWVEKLYVNYTGAPVSRGQPLMSVYSPMLVSAQEELILARKLADESAADPDGVAARNARELLAAARRRLSYWDIPADVIAHIEQTGETQKTVVLRSPADGVVTEKAVVQGTRIMPGTDLFRIADLSTVWLEGDVFEKDLSLVHVGQSAAVTLDAYPGESFRGRVAFIAPSVDLQSRTGSVRVELANPGNRLKPGMYAALQIDVPARTPALVVPRTAVLSTGQRNIVFVRHDDGMLMPHEVRLGLAVGDSVEILGGIHDGATVVSSAGFLVDAESNLGAAMQSMPGMDMGPASQGKGNSSPSPAAPKPNPAVSGPRPGPGPGSNSPAPAAAPMPDMPGMPMTPASPAAHHH